MNKKIFIKAGKEHILGHNHPWIFSQALVLREKIEDGEIVDVTGNDGKRFFARGYYNSKSQIAVRILTRNANEEINEAFFERKFRELMAVRERFIDTKETNAYRVVFGESDGMPGLIVDKYADVFVMQIHTLGMDRLRDTVVAAMKKVFAPMTIFEKSDVGVRVQEGLPDKPVRHIFGKELDGEVAIREHGINFLVNIVDGQKTGFFLDQRDNRQALQKYVRGKNVLNCFCYTGGFSVYSAIAGAASTVSVDVSGAALETAKRNFAANGIDLKNHEFLDKDVFLAFDEFARAGKKFDVIILDPPAFVKNQKTLKKGLSGYLFINERALKMLPVGGILVSSSCSAHVTDEMFQQTLSMAASRAGCGLKTLEIRHQPIDHPFNVHFPEGKYLKFYVMLKT